MAGFSFVLVIINSPFLPTYTLRGAFSHWINGISYFGVLLINSQQIRLHRKLDFPWQRIHMCFSTIRKAIYEYEQGSVLWTGGGR
jgi:hypothetical protein